MPAVAQPGESVCSCSSVTAVASSLREPVDSGGEGITASPVVREHVHGRGGWSQEDDIARVGSVQGQSGDTIHDISVRGRDIEDTDIRRVSLECLGNLSPVRPDEDDGAQPWGDLADQTVEHRVDPDRSDGQRRHVTFIRQAGGP